MRAIEPPPAPISIISSEGTFSGNPEPRNWRLTRAASNVPVNGGLAFADKAGFGRGAAHVEGEQVRFVDARAGMTGRQHAGRRSRLDEADRHVSRGGRCRHAAVGQHDQHRCVNLRGGERTLQPVQIRAHHRLHVGVCHRRHGAFVFADFRRDLTKKSTLRFAGTPCRAASPPAVRARDCGSCAENKRRPN